MLTNNMGQMVQALGFPKRAASACLALFSVAQAASRVAMGALSENALTWKTKVFGLEYGGVPRPAFLLVTCVFCIAGHTVLAFASTRTLFVTGVLLTGMSFGAVWPLMVLIVGDIYGVANHGQNYMFYDGFTSAIGTLLIAKYLAQEVYERHIDPEDENMDDLTCYGEGCFQISHVVVAALCLSSLVASIAMLHMTRSSYGQVVL